MARSETCPDADTPSISQAVRKSLTIASMFFLPSLGAWNTDRAPCSGVAGSLTGSEKPPHLLKTSPPADAVGLLPARIELADVRYPLVKYETSRAR